jgi:ribonuclease P protein subunit POP4
MVTPETLTRHGLIGRPVRVVDAANPELVGIAGRVASESERTLVVRGPAGSGVADRRVPKRDTQFRFALPAGADRVGDQSLGGWVPPADAPARAGGSDTGAAGEPDTEAGKPDTDEAADRRKGSGSAFELPWETLGTGTARPAGKSGGCEDAVYVTVDGQRLLSRPAYRTERAGDSTWQPD